MDFARDLIGYGANPPDPKWPGGARVAVNFVLNYEEGSEYSFMDGDGHSDIFLTEMAASPVKRGDRDLAAESMFEYGGRVGFWRIMRLFSERGLKLTVFACALALERNPAAAEAIRAAGHDICCHGWRWIEHYKLSEDEERDHIRKAVASLAKTMGERPYGWYCRYGPSINTRRLVSEEGGFLYDSDAYNDELPYYVEEGGRPHLVVPYSQANNDTKFTNGLFATSEDYFAFHRDAFDMLYEEGATQPKMMSVGLHCRLIGHPARARGLARLLDHVAAHKDAWVARRIDIARHWLDHHPA
ncbi:allantoinase PuuE [Prosthecomicrobium pneumaticum]|uniref:Chitooligosaccharide deacetylase n=1 Tax=Prosthecomicrobium pneumaticum TaxID=81895 RepID=A0A7W9L1Z8_9HYPH|nr:allantoinase PuuE [Prosthecomicrobium pneumaticum]MBB5753066.1 putative urate catabolism protein [Prosthecomicrobium pneumaticum]